jgi:hypothetical protein
VAAFVGFAQRDHVVLLSVLLSASPFADALAKIMNE